MPPACAKPDKNTPPNTRITITAKKPITRRALIVSNFGFKSLTCKPDITGLFFYDTNQNELILI